VLSASQHHHILQALKKYIDEIHTYLGRPLTVHPLRGQFPEYRTLEAALETGARSHGMLIICLLLASVFQFIYCQFSETSGYL
jgi:hypothetical protein